MVYLPCDCINRMGSFLNGSSEPLTQRAKEKGDGEMNLNDSMELMKKYNTCPKCGNDKIGNGQGTLIIENNVFERSCNCGWKVIVDKRIKIVASATKKIGRKTEGIYEVILDDSKKHKYLPMNELKELAGVKRANQFKKIEEWLNTKEGREWALNTSHVEMF